MVTGKSVGTATITAQTRDGAKTASRLVTVIAAPAGKISNSGFENGNLEGWIIESGTAFTNAGVTNAAVFGNNQPYNHEGNYHLSGQLSGGNAATGVLKSKEFTLGGNGQVSFLIGGGSDIDKLYVSFVRASDGKELFRSSGPGSYWNWPSTKGVTEGYTKRYWDATQYIGTSMYIKIVDERTDEWGHINIDDFNVPVQGGTVDAEAPTAPKNLAATGTTSNSISLSWTASTDNVGVTGYVIYRNGVQAGTSTTAAFTDSGLEAATAYLYTVKAKDEAGNLSAASNSVTATTQAAVVTGSLTNHDFESGNLNGWTIVSGNAFSDADVAEDTSWGWGGPFNQSGKYHLWGFKDGEILR